MDCRLGSSYLKRPAATTPKLNKNAATFTRTQSDFLVVFALSEPAADIPMEQGSGGDIYRIPGQGSAYGEVDQAATAQSCLSEQLGADLVFLCLAHPGVYRTTSIYRFRNG